jgi:frataxin-like iron-binding protein CyaY
MDPMRATPTTPFPDKNSLSYFSVSRSLHKDFDDESGIMLTKGPSMKKVWLCHRQKGHALQKLEVNYQDCSSV